MITEEEFENYYAAFNKRLLSYVRRMVKNDAEDLAAETWLRAWKFRAAFRGESAFYTWLRHIALNVVLAKFRRDKKRQSRCEIADLVNINNLASGENPEQRIVAKFMVQHVFGQCTRKERKLLVMRFIYGFQFDEIGTVTSTKMQTVKSRLNRVKGRIT